VKNAHKLQFSVDPEVYQQLVEIQDDAEARGVPRPNMATVSRMLLQTALNTPLYRKVATETTVVVMRRQLLVARKLREVVVANIPVWLDEVEEEA
jgi:hypothetical protein